MSLKPNAKAHARYTVDRLRRVHNTAVSVNLKINAPTAVLFSKLGAKLALSGRNAENLNRTAAECEKQPGANKVIYDNNLIASRKVDANESHLKINHSIEKMSFKVCF